MFKQLCFCLDIRHDGINHENPFTKVIIEHAGKVCKSLGKNCTHLVWANGRTNAPIKAAEMGIVVVSPLWLTACLEAGCLVETSLYPAQQTRALKRQQPADAQEVKVVSEESDVDKHEFVESRQRRKKDEVYFQKEYAKDVKRLGKTEIHRRDIVDLYVDGDLSLPEFYEQMSLRNSKLVTKTQKRKMNQTAFVESKTTKNFFNNISLAEMLQDPGSKENKQPEPK